MDINRINSFWNWFSNHQNDFGENFDNETLLNELDERVHLFGNLTWEVGPGIYKENALTISPNGDADLLRDTIEIVRLAPDSIKWEFHHAKPPKSWDLKFSVQDENEQEIEIDANDWEYVLLKYPDGKFEIIFKAPQIDYLSDDLKFLAAEIVLEGILGEQKKIELIDGLEIANEFEDQYKGKSSKIANLLDHLNRLNSQ